MLSNGKRVNECNIKNVGFPMTAVTKQKAVPSIGFSTATGNLEREQEVEDTDRQKDWKNEMHLPQLRQLEVAPRMKLSKNNLLMRYFPRLPPMREKVLWQKIRRVRQVSSVPKSGPQSAKCKAVALV